MGRVRLGLLAVTAVALALVGTACGAQAPDRSTASSTTATAGPASATTAAQDGSVPGPTAAAVAGVPADQKPARIAIPAIGVDASMTELGIAPDGSIEVPSEAGEAGWLDTTPAPGQQGPSVVAGHVDSTTGPAVFYRLSSLTPGAEIVVTSRSGSTARFTVDGVRTYAQDDFPTAEVYGPVPGPALRLVTCGGDYIKSDGGYQSNVVVYAS